MTNIDISKLDFKAIHTDEYLNLGKVVIYL